MVRHGQVEPVRHQRVVLAAEHHTDVGRVLPRRVEVGVVADVRRQLELDLGLGVQRAGTERLVVAKRRHVLAQELEDAGTRRAPRRAPERHERVERRRAEGRARVEGQVCEQPGLRKHGQVEREIADGDTDPRHGGVRGTEHAVGQVLNREVGAGIDRHERTHGRVVGDVTHVQVSFPPRQRLSGAGGRESASRRAARRSYSSRTRAPPRGAPPGSVRCSPGGDASGNPPRRTRSSPGLHPRGAG